MPMEVHSVPVYKWRLLPNLWSTVGFSPQEASISTLCRVLPIQGLNLFTIISSPRKFAECLYCDVSSLPILPVASCLIESTCHIQFIQSYKLHSHIYTFTHSCINNFTYSYIHAYTTYTRHHSYIIALVTQNPVSVVSLQFGLYL
jgi:hypothetical protein